MVAGFYGSVVVEEVTPSYYASGDYLARFELTGNGFLGLGQDFSGYISYNNNNPLENKGSTVSYIKVNRIEEMTNDRMVISCLASHTYGRPLYLGCLVDGQGNVIWQNDTQPLP